MAKDSRIVDAQEKMPNFIRDEVMPMLERKGAFFGAVLWMKDDGEEVCGLRSAVVEKFGMTEEQRMSLQQRLANTVVEFLQNNNFMD